MHERLDAIEYHAITKHSVASVRSSRHFLDWDNQPLPFKVYSTLEAIPLPRDFDQATASGDLDLSGLARLLHYTAGITHTKTYPNGHQHSFRAAACTGALYHIDLYVVCAALPDLEAGVYHFGAHDFALRCLRRGDHRRVIADASANQSAVDHAPVILVCTSTFWRNAWKYESRTYRHCFWDNGTMLANLLGVAATAQVPTAVVMGFADRPVNQLLDLDTTKEVAVSCIALGTSATVLPAAPPLQPLGYEVTPLSSHQVDYPAIHAAHEGSGLATPQEVDTWRARAFRRAVRTPSNPVIPLASTAAIKPLPIEQVINRRGSARRFARAAIPYEALSYLLRATAVGITSDFSPATAALATESTQLNDLYLIVNAVDGLAPGAYVYRPEQDAVEILKLGDFRNAAGHLDLGQELAADASVNFYSLSDLDEVVDHLGNRGYRAAALEASITGGRIYLAAYALGFGATGLTFFDDEVTAFFSPHAAGKGVMFLTAIGPRRTSTP